MKSITTRSLTCFLAPLTLLVFCSCVHNDTQTTAEKAPTTEELIAKAAAEETATKPKQLPVRYQNPGFITADDLVDDEVEDDKEYQIKVGANIRSTRGPQPLWDILKRLANLKGLSVSWSSDVNQDVLVDVDISANDNYYDAIENLLRQVDYYHEVEGASIIVRYKQTKTYHIAMPFTKQLYETQTGGNILGSTEESSSINGAIRLDSTQNEFDIWNNIQQNLDAIIATWTTTTSTSPSAASTGGNESETASVKASRQTSDSGNSYTIDKPVGLITVHAPRPLQEKIKNYIDGLEDELFRQIAIEAKIVEVQLTDNSSLGINWNTLIDNLSFGAALGVGKYYSKDSLENKNNRLDDSSAFTYSIDNNGTIDSSDISGAASQSLARTAATILSNGVSNSAAGVFSLSTFNFNDFMKALSQQGTTTILSNPKISVMNGEPALITAGRNVTYIDSIEATVEGTGSESRTVYTVNTERVLSGVGMSLTAVINKDNEIIMNLVPVTSVLEEPIEYRDVGLGQVGLPIVNIREMSTMVTVKDQEMLVIGGLISTTEQSNGQNLFPGLADVPVLKYLTGYEEKVKVKRELIILLRPRII